MVRFAFAAALFAATVLALPSPVVPDPSGEKNIGNGNGVQFIGGACLSSADCASQCCAVNGGNGGVCSGLGAQFQAGKQGCGFGDGGQQPQQPEQQQPPQQQEPGRMAQQPGADSGAPGSQNVGTGNGQQFITGQCTSDADCASGCCGNGLCAARVVAEAAGGPGCGFSGR
ncbi:Biotrophy-associated secreted protein 2 like [Verticillium longisporum]|uniref:Biotrophy-associated secreted protein 2 like n=1 Tax=Verticillium longisporum TaxID=100787 RepID=A0A0G4LQQ8_VERLO|nr:Biotrophy-associated secreted protein 2 like [Verticillium longisporum]KAG7128194.1 Biotrophy-associated secreted protein 2 like [Verticillium longisporum]KAG7152519.1 Biotrophy-associated secreted protein 2 like [Verticillium longisporum]CRK15666.1 hypothetical protein BN1708_011511 [Verticillium longisporum]CRK24308.1 hypothetical protein BN1723_013251 [Verticillium longisporum]